jgi:hypothetical protein
MRGTHLRKEKNEEAELEAELSVQRDVVVQQKGLIEQLRKVQEDTIKEFHSLDKYTSTLFWP